MSRLHDARASVGARAGVFIAAGAVLAGGLLAGPASSPGEATSHLDSPLQILNHRTNAQDFWAFTSEDKPDTVTLVGTYACCQAFIAPPTYGANVLLSKMGFSADAWYDINIDSTGDGKPEITYRWTFSGPLNPRKYELREMRSGQPDRVLATSARVTGSGTDYLVPLSGALGYRKQRAKDTVRPVDGISVWAGKATDPFFFDWRYLNLFNGLVPGAALPPIDITSLTDTNVIAIQVPKKHLALNEDPDRNPVIGAWTAASKKSVNLQTGKSRHVQVSRAGNPSFLIYNTISNHDKWNTLTPDQDHQTPGILEGVADPARKGSPEFFIAGINAKIFGYKSPPAPRRDLQQAYLTGISKDGPFKEDLNTHLLNKDADPEQVVPAEEMRLNMSTPVAAKPSRFGYIDRDRQGWPNGRRFDEDAAIETFGASMTGDLMYGQQLFTGNIWDVFWKSGIVKQQAWRFSKEFPYVPPPTMV